MSRPFPDSRSRCILKKSLGVAFNCNQIGKNACTIWQVMSAPSTCCICFEEYRELFTLLPCSHSRVCHLCLCCFTELICPICKRAIDYTVLSSNAKLEDTSQQPMSSPIKSKIPLSRLIQYRNQRSKEIVQQVYQVAVIGSSHVGFRCIARNLQYTNPCLSASWMQLLEQKIETSKQVTAELVHSLRILEGIEKWNTRYWPNCQVNHHWIRVQCYPFWEWLRILRNCGTSDVILPDVVVTCVAARNKSFYESLEMQKIMYQCYQTRQRKLQSIWVWMTSRENFAIDRKLSLHMMPRMVEKPDVVLWVHENSCLDEYEQLRSQILYACLKSRKQLVCGKNSTCPSVQENLVGGTN